MAHDISSDKPDTATPRTDNMYWVDGLDVEVCTAHFARQLERELSEVRRSWQEARDSSDHWQRKYEETVNAASPPSAAPTSQEALWNLVRLAAEGSDWNRDNETMQEWAFRHLQRSVKSTASTSLDGYPNLQAILDGRVSGHYTEWPMVRVELQRLLAALTPSATTHGCCVVNREWLSLARCPNNGCDNNGSIAHQVGEGEWEQEQCQWCDERAAILSPPDSTVPSATTQSMYEERYEAALRHIAEHGFAEKDWKLARDVLGGATLQDVLSRTEKP